jgi:hypothetical protein
MTMHRALKDGRTRLWQRPLNRINLTVPSSVVFGDPNFVTGVTDGSPDKAACAPISFLASERGVYNRGNMHI